MTLVQVHFCAASAWLGVVAAESVLEQFGRDPASRQVVAKVHAWIDILFEGPLVAVVLITGGLLLARAWPAPPMLMLKVAAGLIAVVANAICIPLVSARARTTDDSRIIRLSRQVRMTGLAIPFGILALAIGLAGPPAL